METLQQRVETWIRDQRTKILSVKWPPQWQWPLAVKWPWNQGREERQRIHEEVERRKKQLQDLCLALKADSVSDLQDILCCMVLSECVYKRPAAEMVRAVNKFKADFGGQVVSLERIQPSADHVPHRYLLAETGDTLFASFVGTKQYKDVMADANIFQGAIFHDDTLEDTQGTRTVDFSKLSSQKSNGENISTSEESKIKQTKPTLKPAAHRGFMARAKGIPALELYRLAQKKKRKLVLCGHSLGGAVAALATLAILRVFAAASKENEKIQLKCITFSQPPVGNAALREYVHVKGWQDYFKTYCIPEDLVPRILSPAYFHHYNARQPLSSSSDAGTSVISKNSEKSVKRKAENSSENEEQLVIGLGPVQNPFWRLSKLVPLDAVRKQLDRYTGKKVYSVEKSPVRDSSLTSAFDSVVTSPQSLEIREDSDGISLQPLPVTDDEATIDVKNGKPSSTTDANKRSWRSMPALPSYVPFGQLYLLGNSSVESLSGAEYSKLTSIADVQRGGFRFDYFWSRDHLSQPLSDPLSHKVRSVIAEVKERFQSHSMRSYRARFQRIYELFMNESGPILLGMEQVQQFPHLQKWLGISVAGTVELGHIVESPVIHAATSIVPLGWCGIPCEKNADPLKVDISGYGLHLCTLIQARVDGNWCPTTVENFPSPPAYSVHHGLQPEIQKMRVLIGAPLRRRPKHPIVDDAVVQVFPAIDLQQSGMEVAEAKSGQPDGLRDFVIFCQTDFSTVSKEVDIRTRRVRLIGLEGAGKSSLLNAILNQGRSSMKLMNLEALHTAVDVQEGIAGGLCYTDSAAVNLQNLSIEASRFRDELWKGIRDLSLKTDLIVLVHNLSHRIPRLAHTDAGQQQPAISLLLDEAKSLGIPWVLAITNKFSVSAHQQKAAIDAVIKAYQATPSITSVINSCPYFMPSAEGTPTSWEAGDTDSGWKMAPAKLIFAPLGIALRPFQKKASVLPVEGVTAFCMVIHRILRVHEEAAFEELARDRLYAELARQRAMISSSSQEARGKANSTNAAAVGASLGAGLGIVLAIVMGAASALRKP